MNIFQFKDFTFMLDYAHNADGLRALSRFLSRTEASRKVGIISGLGDRRNKDTIELGYMAAQVFDEIIIRHDEEKRGKSDEELSELLCTGIYQADPGKKVIVISREMEAIRYAVQHAQKGDFITLCSEKVHEAIQLIRQLKEAENIGIDQLVS